MPLERRLAATGGVTPIVLLTPAGRLRRYLAAVAVDLVRLGPRGWIRAGRLLAAGRLRIMTRPLADPRTIAALRRLRADVGLHDMPVIYPRSVIDCFELGILNAHIGLLPKYRGRSVMEWSILNGDATGITTFFIDEGIDTGSRIVLRREVSVTGFADVQAAKDYLFSLAGEMYAKALEALQDPALMLIRQRVEEGTRWYVMSKLLTGVVDRVLTG
jgi:methionyl-tRNA formyltransferase